VEYSGVISPVLELNMYCVSGTSVSLGLSIVCREIVGLPIILYCLDVYDVRVISMSVIDLRMLLIEHTLYKWPVKFTGYTTCQKILTFLQPKGLHHCHICK